VAGGPIPDVVSAGGATEALSKRLPAPRQHRRVGRQCGDRKASLNALQYCCAILGHAKASDRLRAFAA
jgi:hypothetical protein